MLFKILHGDESRISTDITPFHEGYCYVSHSGCMYIDMNIGTEESPNNQRIKLNAKDAETLGAYTADEFILKAEIDDLELITVADIDTICNNTPLIQNAEEVSF